MKKHDVEGYSRLELNLQDVIDTTHDYSIFPRLWKDVSCFWSAYERMAKQHDLRTHLKT